MRLRLAGMLAFASAVPLTVASAGGLGGSPASMRLQHRVAESNAFTFVKTPAQLRAFVDREILDPVDSSDDVLLRDVSFPFARPAVRAFIERLAAEYSLAFDEPLIVTSLTRPLSAQPPNAHKLSVHPTGMAVDFRVPATAEQRAWLEEVLLDLEAQGLLDVTREKHPPHYHVAVFPEKYAAYAATLPPLPPRAARRALSAVMAGAPAPPATGDAFPPLSVAAILGLGLSGLLGSVATRNLRRASVTAR